MAHLDCYAKYYFEYRFIVSFLNYIRIISILDPISPVPGSHSQYLYIQMYFPFPNDISALWVQSMQKYMTSSDFKDFKKTYKNSVPLCRSTYLAKFGYTLCKSLSNIKDVHM